jgi:hypothetical protein
MNGSNVSAVVRVAFVLLLLAGCKQGEGERCQLRSDCAEGLQCVVPMSESCQNGGTCQPEQPNGKLCSSDRDCDPGFSCRESRSCTDENATVCTTPPDM